MNDARTVLRRWAYAAGHVEAELDDAAERVYALVAHELAEKIRARCTLLYGSPNALRPGLWADEGYGLLDAADLIDPEHDGS